MCIRDRLRALPGLVEAMRMVKSADEIALIEESVKANSAAYERALSRFRPAMKEMELAAEIEYQMKLAGAEKTAFDTIVAGGQRSALPHARPSMEPIPGNELLLMDMGALRRGYASDMTRVAVPGRPTRRMKDYYNAVLDAQLAAIAAVKPGIKASAVDRAARRVLRAHQLDHLFTHSTGHGLGLNVHEAPRLGRRPRKKDGGKEDTPLEAGMALTIEPGVYVPGWGGIRIEDTVVVTRGGCRVLTPTPKQLQTL